MIEQVTSKAGMHAAHKSAFHEFGMGNCTSRNKTARQQRLVNLLHLGCLVSSPLHLLEGRQIVVITQTLIIIVNAQTKLDHAMNTACKLRWLVKVETRGEQGCIEEQPDQI